MPARGRQNENQFRQDGSAFLLLREDVGEMELAGVRLHNERRHFPVVERGHFDAVMPHEIRQMYHRHERDQPHYDPHCLAPLTVFRDERDPERFQLKPGRAKKWPREHPIQNAGCDQGDERAPQTVGHVLDRIVSLRPVNVFREGSHGRD